MYILQCYRRYKLRQYLLQLRDIGAETKRVYQQQRPLTVQQRAYFENWPQPPKTLVSVVAIIKRIYRRWKAWLLLSRIPREQWPEFR